MCSKILWSQFYGPATHNPLKMLGAKGYRENSSCWPILPEMLGKKHRILAAVVHQ